MASEIDTSESTLCRVIWDACKAADIGLAGMSWSGKNLHGTRASIDYAERAIRHYEQREVWSKEWLSRIEALAAERDAAQTALREREAEALRLTAENKHFRDLLLFGCTVAQAEAALATPPPKAARHEQAHGDALGSGT